MNDFFTELDSDLRGEQKTNEKVFENTLPQKTPSPHRELRERVSVPLQKKPEPREQRSMGTDRTQDSKKRVTEVRSQMMEAGVVALVFKADEKSKMLLWHLKLETRGFVYLDEVREIHKMIIKKARASYEDTVRDIPDIEEKDLIKIIRRDLEIFLLHKLDRNPVIIPMILYV